MVVTLSHRLVDGPLALISCPVASEAARKWRARTVEEMAATLLLHDAAGNRGDAIDVLLWANYPLFDVMAMVDEAIFEAKQRKVAKEISAP